MLERWRSVLRDGLWPLLSRDTLARLREALLAADPDDPHRGGEFCQSTTAVSMPSRCSPLGDTVVRACLLGWCVWKGDPEAVAPDYWSIRAGFERLCNRLDYRMTGVPWSPTSALTTFFDESPWHHVREELIRECDLALAGGPAEGVSG